MSEILVFEKKEDYCLIKIKVKQLQMMDIPIFHKEMKLALEKNPKNIIIDFTETNYLDSSALGAIFKVHTSISKYKGQLFMFGFNQTIHLILSLTKADKILKIYKTLDEILKKIS